MKHTTIFLLLFILSTTLQAQHVEILTKGISSSIRGVSAVDDQVVWISGSNGRVGRSIDGGANWKWIVVKDFEKRDFRDIEAFDKNTAVIMAIAEPATILKTIDGGDTWKSVYENHTKGMFMDAMEFYNDKTGIVIGDPINGKMFLATTSDNGDSWKDVAFDKLPAVDSGEACFASSGTNIRKLYNEEYAFLTGGSRARYFTNRSSVQLPLVQGTRSTGGNSIAIWNPDNKSSNQYMITVGGNFAKDSISDNNCFISKDGGKTWLAPAVTPEGYKSCVEFITRQQVITCGTSGVDISIDGGMNWKPISKEGFHVCRKAKNGKAVFLAGGGGKIGKLVL